MPFRIICSLFSAFISEANGDSSSLELATNPIWVAKPKIHTVHFHAFVGTAAARAEPHTKVRELIEMFQNERTVMDLLTPGLGPGWPFIW